MNEEMNVNNEVTVDDLNLEEEVTDVAVCDEDDNSVVLAVAGIAVAGYALGRTLEFVTRKAIIPGCKWVGGKVKGLFSKPEAAAAPQTTGPAPENTENVVDGEGTVVKEETVTEDK